MYCLYRFSSFWETPNFFERGVMSPLQVQFTPLTSAPVPLLKLLSIRSLLTFYLLFVSFFAVFIHLDLSLGFDIINCFTFSWCSLLHKLLKHYFPYGLLLQLLFSNLMVLCLTFEMLIIPLVHTCLSCLILHLPRLSHLFSSFYLPYMLLTLKPISPAQTSLFYSCIHSANF